MVKFLTPSSTNDTLLRPQHHGGKPLDTIFSIHSPMQNFPDKKKKNPKKTQWILEGEKVYKES